MPDRIVAVDSLAQSDFYVFTDTSAHIPDGFSHWFAIRPLEADITPTLLGVKGGDALSGQVLTKDVVYPGRFDEITLAAGKVIAYRSNS